MKSNIPGGILFLKLCLTSIILLASYSVSSIFAQVGTVYAVYSNGQPVGGLNLKILGAKSGAAKLVSVSKGFTLSSGDKIEIPAGCGIQFQSPRGSQNVFATGAKPILYSVKFIGGSEEHIINGTGQIKSHVTVAGQLGASYKVGNGEGISASTSTTVYTFSNFGGNNQANLKTEEGKIEILEEVTMKITNNSEKINNNGPKSEQQKYPTKSVSNIQTAGYENTYGGKSLTYSNYNEAINALIQEINYQRQINADYEELMDNYTTLGELQLDLGYTANAIESFKGALYYCSHLYYNFEMEYIEINLYLAEAYMDNGNQNESAGIINQCIALLNENLQYDADDLEYAGNDYELREFICEYIYETYDFLGWAYDIAGYTDQADQYYSAGCQ